MEIPGISNSTIWGFPTETIARSPIVQANENADRMANLARQGILRNVSGSALEGRITPIIYALSLDVIKTDLRVRFDLLHM